VLSWNGDQYIPFDHHRRIGNVRGAQDVVDYGLHQYVGPALWSHRTRAQWLHRHRFEQPARKLARRVQWNLARGYGGLPLGGLSWRGVFLRGAPAIILC